MATLNYGPRKQRTRQHVIGGGGQGAMTGGVPALQ